MNKRQALILIDQEYFKARIKFPPMNSPHEGYAILLEEVEELWEAIKSNESENRIASEATQVGAMALRFLCDLVEIDNSKRG